MSVQYVFGAKLPLETDVVMMITGQAPSSHPSRETVLRKKVINDFTKSIINLWAKAFGMEYIQSRQVVQEEIIRLLATFYHEYYVLSSGSKKRKAEHVWKSKRQLFSVWAAYRRQHMKLFCLLKKDVKVDDFNEDEKFFLQKSTVQPCWNHMEGS